MRNLTELLRLDPISRYERLIRKKNDATKGMNAVAGVCIIGGWSNIADQEYRRLEDKLNYFIGRVEDLRKKYPDVKEIQ